MLGAGIAGVSAALEAARLGRKVALVDGLPALGGQAVNSIIGTFCGLFANGTRSTLVGIDRRRTTTGASANWQILIPADRPRDIGVTSWRQKLGMEAS